MLKLEEGPNMVEHESPKVYLKIKGQKDLFEVRLCEYDKCINARGEPEHFYAAFELRDQYGGSHFFDSTQVDIEDVLAEYKIV